MGLLDILNGMQKGPRGQSDPSRGRSRGGMSPMLMALLGVLAYKAVKSFGSPSSATAQPAQPTGTGAGGLSDLVGRMFGGGSSAGAAGGPVAGASGSLAEMPGDLGTLLGGGAAGTLVSSGLGTLVQEFQERGYGHEAQSWVGNGQNAEIAPNDMADALGADTLDALTRQTGMNRSELLAGLAQHLPELIHQLTPNGRLPTEDEASRSA